MIKSYFETELGKLYHGDCLKIIPLLRQIDLVLTDPPYGIDRDEGFEGFGGFGTPIARRQYSEKWDSERPSKECFDMIIEKAKLSLIFGGNFFADLLPISTHWLVWDKLNTMPTFGDCELIWTNSNRKSVKKYICQYNGLMGRKDKRIHPTQKPVKLIIDILLKYSKDYDLILDPFLGSGTLAIACEKINRKWIGIELNEKYCAMAADRIKKETAQYKLDLA